MKKLFLAIISIFIAVPMSAQRAASYANPVIPGYHPDPSVCRVGDDFYLVNSSFMCFPGVPVYHSRDLVNWELIGNVLTRESQLPLKDATSWLGIYAPTLRYHDGLWYMITTNVGNGGNFMVTAKKPEGPWSEPIWLKQDGIDPSLFWENGKCYMMSNPGDCIWLCEINPKTGKQLTESRPLWQGTGGRYPEGPHIYKKDGWYYLLISEGGTELAHRLTIARSRNIYGPYEPNPDNPILTNCSRKGQTKQVQGTGHGDFVQAADGSWWLVFLAYRNMGGSYHHLGRETYLAPVEWKEGEWPVVNGGEPIDTLMKATTLPLKPFAPKKRQQHDKIDLTSPEWVHLQNPVVANYEQQNGRLRLFGAGSLTENNRPTFVGRRQEHARMTVETEVEMADYKPGQTAGLSVYQINDGHMDFYLTRRGDYYIVHLHAKLKSMEDDQMYVIGDHNKVKLRIVADEQHYRFEYSFDGLLWQTLTVHDAALMSTEVAGGFTGVIIGMFATQGHVRGSYADFSYFDYREN